MFLCHSYLQVSSWFCHWAFNLFMCFSGCRKMKKEWICPFVCIFSKVLFLLRFWYSKIYYYGILICILWYINMSQIKASLRLKTFEQNPFKQIVHFTCSKASWKLQNVKAGNNYNQNYVKIQCNFSNCNL